MRLFFLYLCALHAAAGAVHSLRAEPFYHDCVTHEKAQRLDLWNANNNAERFTNTMDFLTNNSVVVFAGGYKGHAIAPAFDKYGFYAHVFEPVTAYFLKLTDLFDGYAGRVFVHRKGFAASNTTGRIHLSEDGSRVVAKGNADTEEIQLTTFDSFYYGALQKLHAGHIDLLYVNCEGCEYDLLADIIDKKFVASINYIFVQFHGIAERSNHVHERCALRSKLLETHEPVFNFPFVWEGWRRKKAAGFEGV